MECKKYQICDNDKSSKCDTCIECSNYAKPDWLKCKYCSYNRGEGYGCAGCSGYSNFDPDDYWFNG